jgi:glycosyltransferase involved in cell wall biosynthesis
MKAFMSLSIIIPAYNEADIIIDTLTSLLEDQQLQKVELIVVCNSCTDTTAQTTRQFSIQRAMEFQQRNIVLSIIETPVASKTNAINLGINQAVADSVLLLDADILISGASILCLLEKMQLNKVPIASPRVQFNYKNSHFLVRQYYKVAEKSTYNLSLRISNVIALSKLGIARIGVLPKVIADDEFIRQSFAPHERLVVKECQFQFYCPKDLGSLIRTLTRIKIGNLQLSKKNNHRKTRFQLGITHKTFPMLVFGLIKTIALLRAQWQIKTHSIPVWERDESSRNKDKLKH